MLWSRAGLGARPSFTTYSWVPSGKGVTCLCLMLPICRMRTGQFFTGYFGGSTGAHVCQVLKGSQEVFTSALFSM